MVRGIADREAADVTVPAVSYSPAEPAGGQLNPALTESIIPDDAPFGESGSRVAANGAPGCDRLRKLLRGLPFRRKL